LQNLMGKVFLCERDNQWRSHMSNEKNTVVAPNY
jgi:hypothetical protein